MRSKRAFSILEVMIAIAIITTLGASIAINFYKGYKERQEKDAVDLVESKLRMAAQLAKLSDGEVRVLFDSREGKYSISFDHDINVSERMKANLGRKTALANVREILLVPNSTQEQALSYFPWGLLESNVQLELIFESGRRYALKPQKYVPNVIVEERNVIEDHFPREVLEDEKEEKLVHVD